MPPWSWPTGAAPLWTLQSHLQVPLALPAATGVAELRRAASDCGRGEEGRACAAGRVPSPPLLSLREASHRVAYIFLTNSALTLGEEGVRRGLDPVTHPTNARLRTWFLLKEVHDDAKAMAAHTCCIMSGFYFLL